MRVHFEAIDNTTRLARTDGLVALGQTEIDVPLPWTDDPERDAYVTRLLRFIEAYVTEQPRHIEAGQTLTYGWTTLRFVRQEPSVVARLRMQELCEPFGAGSATYCDGAARAVELLRVQENALRRNRVTGTSDHPHRMSWAISCTKAVEQAGSLAEPLMLERISEPDAHDSGWVLHCAQLAERPTHNHDDPNELHRVHALHIATDYPMAFAYLGMPVGSAVLLLEQEVVVFRPGENDGIPDHEALRTLPSL